MFLLPVAKEQTGSDLKTKEKLFYQLIPCQCCHFRKHDIKMSGKEPSKPDFNSIRKIGLDFYLNLI